MSPHFFLLRVAGRPPPFTFMSGGGLDFYSANWTGLRDDLSPYLAGVAPAAWVKTLMPTE